MMHDINGKSNRENTLCRDAFKPLLTLQLGLKPWDGSQSPEIRMSSLEFWALWPMGFW